MKTKKQRIINGIFVAVMLVLSLFFLFPVIWMIANSFKQDAAITADMNSVRAFVPPAPGKGFFDNYKEILFNTSFLRYMLNTLFYAAILIVAGVIVNGLAGYALAKIKFPFRDRWLAIIMMLMIIPTTRLIFSCSDKFLSVCPMMSGRLHSWITAIRSNISLQWCCQCPKQLLQPSAFSHF